MPLVINFTSNGIVVENEKRDRPARPDRGKSIIAFPNEYVIIDIETTGLDSRYDSIIEVCALKIKNGTVIDTFSSLINSRIHIDEFIEELTGITDEMLLSAPYIEDVLPQYIDFIGNSIVIGHRVSFDVNFLYDSCVAYLGFPFRNDFVDTLRIFRKLHPELEHHRLSDLVDFYQISDVPAHRAEADCIATLSGFLSLQNEIIHKYCDTNSFSALFRSNKQDFRSITPTTISFDETNPFYKKHCVFTGTLELFTRHDAAQIITNLGGIPDNGITKHTNYLILGNNDYCSTIKDGKSNKQKKAEEYLLRGYDITIISEHVFYEMLDLQRVDNSISIEEQIFERLKKGLEKSANPDFISLKKQKSFSSVYYNKSSLLCRIAKYKDNYCFDISSKYRNLFSEFQIVLSPDSTERTIIIISELDAVEKMADCFAAIIKAFPTPSTFDICHRYMECSDNKKCIHPDPVHALECSYRKKLEEGIIFYGVNRNID